MFWLWSNHINHENRLLTNKLYYTNELKKPSLKNNQQRTLFIRLKFILDIYYVKPSVICELYFSIMLSIPAKHIIIETQQIPQLLSLNLRIVYMYSWAITRIKRSLDIMTCPIKPNLLPLVTSSRHFALQGLDRLPILYIWP